jgi:cell division protein FtsN
VIVDATPNNKTATFLFGGLIGFVAGLVVAGVLAVWIYNATPFRPETSSAARGEPAKAKVEPKPTGKAADVATNEPKTEAERVLPPGISMNTPAASAPAAPPPAPPAAKAPARPDPEPSPSAEARGRLWLQVGAYINRQDAENQRARFAVLGYEAQIQNAEVPDKGTVYRVRVGPYRDPDEAGKVRGDLARQGIEVTVIKP